MISNAGSFLSTFEDTIEQSRDLLAQVAERSRAIQQQLLIAKQQLLISRELLARSTIQLASPLIRMGRLTTNMREPTSEAGSEAPRFEAVSELIQQVERSATTETGLVTQLIEDIMLALESSNDANLLIGVLLQGLIQTVQERLPAADQRETAIALCGLLWDRVSNGGA